MHPIIDINTYLALPITNTILLDCRFTLGLPDKGREDFNRGHIPNAQHIVLEKDLSGPIQLHGGRHPLPSIEDIEKTFQRFGVNGDSQVVLYDDKNMAYAARAWWILKYIGHDNVLIIDGGISEWIRQKHPLSTETITLPKGNLIASPNAQMLVFREDVIHSNNILLIDSRAPDRYSGAVEPLDKVAGHIPNAINMFYRQIVIHRGLPFPVRLPSNNLINAATLTDMQLDQEITRGFDDIAAGRKRSLKDAAASLTREFTL